MTAYAPLTSARYLESARNEIGRLQTLAAAAAPDATVPGCPGWTTAKVVAHVADVYLRQSSAIQVGHRIRPGSPEGAQLPGEDLQAYLLRGVTEILATIDRPADLTCWTWPDPEGQLLFWQRRMAQETLMHRVDLEQAAARTSIVDADLAADGVDEVLTVFLPLSLPSAVRQGQLPEDLRASVTLATGDMEWTVEVTGAQATVRPGSGDRTQSVLRGEPADVLLWCWGRGTEELLTLGGDLDQIRALRQALIASTQ